MTYRDDLVALAARREALERELTHKARELAETEQLLDEARERTRLPVLDNIRVASPCKVEWSTMSGDERVRHCGTCDKQVFNLSNMTRDEAEALLLGATGKLCGRYYQRADGTILLADCAVGVDRRKRRQALGLGGAAMLASALAINAIPERVEDRPLGELGIAGTEERVAVHPHLDEPPQELRVMQGDIEF